MKVIYQLNDNQIKQLHEHYQQEWWTKDRTLKQTQKIIKNSNIIIGMVDENNNLIAFVRVLTDFTIKALILDLIVDHDYRDKGLGKELLMLIKNYSDLKEVKHLELYCLPKMEGYYKQFAFKSVEELSFMRMEKR